jgi:hypothetical protein
MSDNIDQKIFFHFSANLLLINMKKLIYLKGHHIPKTNILPARTFRPRN